MLRNLLCLFFFIVFSFAKEHEDISTNSSETRYDGYSVLRIIPTVKEELEFIRSLRTDLELDFWIEPNKINGRTDVMIPPWKIEKIKFDLENRNINFSVWIENVQSLIDKEREELKRFQTSSRSKRSPRTFFRTYHRASEICEYLYSLKRLYPSLMTIENIGITFEGRQVKLVKIRTNPKEPKPIIWIDGGIHAREWISPATATYFIYKLLREYKTNDLIHNLMEIYDFYIVPLINPDGYEYSHTYRNRLWRKNRSRSKIHKNGVDLNRNFKYGWNSDLTSSEEKDPNSLTYRGPFAMSERESQAIESVLLPVKQRVKLFISLHSYSQYIMFPWDCKEENVEEYEDLKTIGMRAATEIQIPYGTTYQVDSGFKLLDAATGTSADWAYGELGIKYSFVIELRDKGKQGFQLSPNQIYPVGEETFKGVLSIIYDITENRKWEF